MSGEADLELHLSAAEAVRSLLCGEESAVRLKADDTGLNEDIICYNSNN
jgi:hypothetical protein